MDSVIGRTLIAPKMSTAQSPLSCHLSGKGDFGDKMRAISLDTRRLPWILWVSTIQSHILKN